VDEIIHAADVALYAAKAAGRNRVRVAQSLPFDGGKENVQPESPVLAPCGGPLSRGAQPVT
jgi:hypothetical protein